MSHASTGITRRSSETAYMTRLALAPLNGQLSATQVVFDLRNWVGHYISLQPQGTDAFLLFSDQAVETIDENATLTVAPPDADNAPTGCCFVASEGSTEHFFVHPKYPYLHAKRAYPLNGFLRIVRA